MIKILDKDINLYENKILFGASNYGKEWLEILDRNDIEINCFADNDSKKWGGDFDGKPIISLRDLYNMDKTNSIVIITSTIGQRDIFEQLRISGFKNIYIGVNSVEMKIMDHYDNLSINTVLENLSEIVREKRFIINDEKSAYEPEIYMSFGIEMNKIKYIINPQYIIDYLHNVQKIQAILEDEKSKKTITNIALYKITGYGKLLEDIYEPIPYFSNSIFKFNDNEILVDGGSYVGDTIKQYIKFSNDKYNKIYAFEPNKYIYVGLEQLFENEKRIITINKGISKEEEKINFEDAGTGSRINSNGEMTIETTSLDSCIKEKITFIKLDIEGNEISGLQGSKRIIDEFSPKLAICIYHKENDLWEIPMFIKKLKSNYKLYIRHHRIDSCYETVCYATID